MSQENPEIDALTAFNQGIPLIIETPYHVKVMLQKNGESVRAAIITNEKDDYEEIIRNAGGINAIVLDALGIIGVKQKIEPGSGTLQANSNVSTDEALGWFNFPDQEK